MLHVTVAVCQRAVDESARDLQGHAAGWSWRQRGCDGASRSVLGTVDGENDVQDSVGGEIRGWHDDEGLDDLAAGIPVGHTDPPLGGCPAEYVDVRTRLKTVYSGFQRGQVDQADHRDLPLHLTIDIQRARHGNGTILGARGHDPGLCPLIGVGVARGGRIADIAKDERGARRPGIDDGSRRPADRRGTG